MLIEQGLTSREDMISVICDWVKGVFFFFFFSSEAASKTLCQITCKPAVSKVGACITFSKTLEWSLLSGKWHIMQGHTMTLY